MKDILINKLTLLDTAMYRFSGLHEKPSKYKKEPSRFRLRLMEIYNKLEVEDLEELLKIKQGK